jgi:hypothetical protein
LTAASSAAPATSSDKVTVTRRGLVVVPGSVSASQSTHHPRDAQRHDPITPPRYARTGALTPFLARTGAKRSLAPFLVPLVSARWLGGPKCWQAVVLESASVRRW